MKLRALCRGACLWLGTLSFLVLVHPQPAAAQGSGGPPGIDHYKVYRVLPPPQGGFPVVLRDQFMINTDVAREFAYFATPVSKDGFPIFDPRTHYDWWTIEPRPIPGVVFATNQFGADQQLGLREASFLLAPSLKFPVPGEPLPTRNHYKCYAVIGPSPERVVTLEDQFGINQAFVGPARYFCNPVEKQTADGRLFPIEDPEAHLVCYDITKTPPSPVRTIVARDQFGFWNAVLVEDAYLCVPSFKTGVVPTLPQTWGAVKAIYR
jgi:hypothetical protein